MTFVQMIVQFGIYEKTTWET